MIGRLLNDIFEGRLRKKKWKGRPRSEYFPLIIKDIGFETFKVKELASDKILRWYVVLEKIE